MGRGECACLWDGGSERRMGEPLVELGEGRWGEFGARECAGFELSCLLRLGSVRV